MKYCIECGTKLINKQLDREGLIPYCTSCKQYRFPFFSTACSMIVFNQSKDKMLLIKQYGGNDYILVAGYVNKGENVEYTVCREIKEEIGATVTGMIFNATEYYAKSNTLMINFAVTINEDDISFNDEIDEGKWMSIKEARENIKQGSLAQKFLEKFIEKQIF